MSAKGYLQRVLCQQADHTLGCQEAGEGGDLVSEARERAGDEDFSHWGGENFGEGEDRAGGGYGGRRVWAADRGRVEAVSAGHEEVSGVL